MAAAVPSASVLCSHSSCTNRKALVDIHDAGQRLCEEAHAALRGESPDDTNDLLGPVIISCSLNLIDKVWRRRTYQLIIVLQFIHHLHRTAVHTVTQQIGLRAPRGIMSYPVISLSSGDCNCMPCEEVRRQERIVPCSQLKGWYCHHDGSSLLWRTA